MRTRAHKPKMTATSTHSINANPLARTVATVKQVKTKEAITEAVRHAKRIADSTDQAHTPDLSRSAGLFLRTVTMVKRLRKEEAAMNALLNGSRKV